MKNSTSNNNFHDNSSRLKEESSENSLNKNNFSPKPAKSTMTEQIIIPPARVWDKIEKILDEQDNRRDDANKIIASSFRGNNYLEKKKIYLATVAGLSVVAGLVWAIL